MAYQETQELYYIDVDDDRIQTIVTNSPSAVDSWISDIEYIHRRRLHRLVVGLDVEWRPPFSRAAAPVATLQLCVGRRCLVLQLLHAPYLPDSLRRFLSDGDYTFVGVGVHRDAEKLLDEQGLAVANCVDIAELAAQQRGDAALGRAGVKGLARAVLGLEVDKPKWVTLSAWDDRSLSFPQVRYAATDAFASFEIGRVLEAWNY